MKLRCYLLAVLLGTTAWLPAQTPRLVTDLNQTPLNVSSIPSGFVRLGTLTYFAATTAEHGTELWITDGTEAGTRVLDILPGPLGSNPRQLTAVGSRVFFFAMGSPELWVSNGTPGGTRLVRSAPATGTDRWLQVTWTAAFGQGPSGATTFAFASRVGTGVTDNLWTSDGTSLGTGGRLTAFGGMASPVSFSGELYFLMKHHSDSAIYVVAVGGTPVAGRYVAFAAGGSDPRPYTMAELNGKLFVCHDGQGFGLQRVQGSALVLVSPVEFATSLVRLGGILMFAARGSPAQGIELWRSDGTPAGTQLVADLEPGIGSSLPRQLTVAGSNVYFVTSAQRFWASDGTAQGTRALLSGVDASQLYDFEGRLLFVVGASRLWISDGTLAGTHLLRDFAPYALRPDIGLASAGSGLAVFTASDRINGEEPWITDGTVAGTKMLKDLNGVTGSTRSSTPAHLVDLNGRLAFFAEDGGGPRVYRTDGTAAGTTALSQTTQIANGAAWRPAVLGNTLFTPFYFPGSGWRLTAHDTTGLRFLGAPNPLGLVASDDAVWLRALDPMTGLELWRSDGTIAGTILVKNINPGNLGSNPQEITPLGDLVLFAADDGQSGVELWRSDGTDAGTIRLADIHPGIQASTPRGLVAMGSAVYFTANDGTRGSELWASDGTPAGTVLVHDIDPGPRAGNPGELTVLSTPTGRRLVFAASELAYGRELWTSTGSSPSTRRIQDIRSGGMGSDPRLLTAAGERVFFTADDGAHGRELWVTDGTAAGTVLVKDIVTGTATSDPQELCSAGSRRLFFTALDGQGRELWVTDGTEAGTTRVADLWPGSDSSNPRYLTFSYGRLFFAADDGVHGEELFVLDAPANAQPTGPRARLLGSDPVLGASAALWSHDAPASAPGVAMLGLPATAPFSLSSGQWLRLDLLAPMLPLTTFVTQSPSWRSSVPIPDQAALAGARVMVQAAYVSGGRLALHNGLVWTLGR
jgi:ELWxxDGT repeat protein